ncbi:MAG: hypothetical protein V3R60_00605, partial [Acidobacteriota bacterium]
VVLRNALAIVVEKTKEELGDRVALLGGLEIPLPRLDVILRDAYPEFVLKREVVLRFYITLLSAVLEGRWLYG